ncbi:MAG: UvrD-helicase domain-containing protein [Sedimentisphaerales bacterium]|nr:UvrD-helicase domain-containing protein [Sedimentisphaerales bacterium]
MSAAFFSSDIPIEDLTESQRKAVYHVDGPLLVVAGPGSGKTRVIISRIAALINSGVSPYNICAITFTNKAAQEMRTRLEGMGAGTSGAHISTFHSLCVKILRWYGQRAGIGSNFSIYDDNSQKRCMKEAVRVSGVDTSNFAPARMLGVISRFKNDLESPEDIKVRGDDYFMKNTAKIYENYQKILSDNNALDFDDLLVKTAFLLRNHPEVRSELNRRFKYLLVDEYQDTNHAQYQIARGLAIEHSNICVTGDPDQSIYRWRGADIGNILAFETDWPNAVVVKLEENFRSTPNILELADKLIASNKQRKQKTLIPTLERGEDVIVQDYPDDSEEAFSVAREIQKLIYDGSEPSEIAVFYRVNSMSRAIEESLIQKRIPYQVVRGVEFYARKEIRDMLAYLKVMVNPDDDIAFVRAIGTHPRGIGKTTLDKLAIYASENGIGLNKAAEKAHLLDSTTEAIRAKLTMFAAMLEKFRKDAEGEVAPLMERVFSETGLLEYLQTQGSEGESAVENINELINSAAEYDKQIAEPNLTDYLQTIALYSDTDAYDAKSGKVSLMTLHAAKGLEFDNVFIEGLEEGLLPHERSADNQEELEEERRLFFVGITRARRRLFISLARHRVMRGQYLRTVPSQFLYEAGFDLDQINSESSEDAEESDRIEDYYDSQVPQEAPFRVNELVEHMKFGTGRVKEFLNLGEDSIVVVEFSSGKVKSLMLKYAKLTKVNINK